MITDDELKTKDKRLLAVDKNLVFPVPSIVRLLITSYDVIHSFALPSHGVKFDATPGRLNVGYLDVVTIGIFFGQCSELCGVNHSFMPVVLSAVEEKEFASQVVYQLNYISDKDNVNVTGTKYDAFIDDLE
jgi:cytochrome c oxidase subunit 2